MISLDDAIMITEAGTASREIDYLIHWHSARRIKLPDLDSGEDVPEFIPHYTREIDKAFLAIQNVAPYASYRLSWDASQLRWLFSICGETARGIGQSTTIIAGLLMHVRHRIGEQQRDIYKAAVDAIWKTPIKEQVLGRSRRVGKAPELAAGYGQQGIVNGIDLGKGDQTVAVLGDHPGGGTLRILAYFNNPSAAECALKLRDRAYLTKESDDDAWCEAMVAYGFVPRDLLPELEAIKSAVFKMRGQ